jgi:hypothetical protein
MNWESLLTWLDLESWACLLGSILWSVLFGHEIEGLDE